MRILVTGGAGYVGCATVETLLAAGHAVVVLDSLVTSSRGRLPAEARLVEGSVADRPAVAELLRSERIEAVLHCAARSLVGESMRDPGLYLRENVAGGIALLDALADAGVDRFVFSSSAAVYGVPERTPIDEETPAAPINPYGASKLALETALRAWGARGLRAISLRYFNVAGASERSGEAHDPETHLIPNLLAAARTGEPVTLFGDDFPTPDGTPVRDYIHVLDLADAHLAALERTEGIPAGLTVCNLGTGHGFSVKEVLAAAEAVTGRPIPRTVGPRRAGDPPVLVAANERARTLLGWTPRRSTLPEMIGSAWAWEQRRGEVPA